MTEPAPFHLPWTSRDLVILTRLEVTGTVNVLGSEDGWRAPLAPMTADADTVPEILSVLLTLDLEGPEILVVVGVVATAKFAVTPMLAVASMSVRVAVVTPSDQLTK
jgi:hypothetical protein